MSARLFRSIRSTVSSLNKTVFSIVVLAAIIFLHTTSALAIEKADLDLKYAPYINNFTTATTTKLVSGLSGGTVQKATSNNDAVGLVFTVNIGVDTSTNGDRASYHFGRIAKDPKGGNTFLIKLCMDGNATKCWLNAVKSGDAKVNPNEHIISLLSDQENVNDSQSLSVSAFTTSTDNTVYSYNPTTNTTVRNLGVVLEKGVPLTATLWYCAGGDGSTAAADYAKNKFSVSNPTSFGPDICGGFSYFQIGTPLKITIPTDAAVVEQQVADSKESLAAAPTATAKDDDNLPTCVLAHPVSGEGTINGCGAEIAYGIFYITSWIAGIFGKLFDFFIGYSVSDQSYRYTFAVTGWKLVRDISNIFFIIIMVWTGFSAVFNTSKNSMRSVVPNLIINALLINFSLFATRVVIDISNITARMFYSQMIVCEKANIDADGKCPVASAKRGTGGYWPLSEKIVSSFNPQQMFSPKILQPPSTGAAISERDYANYFMVVSLVATFIMAAIGVMFFKVAFLFLGRVVGLYICMIFAPFAFLSREMPMLGGIERLRWNDWKKELVNYALLAPIFTFFLYIIYTFLSSDFVKEIGFVDTTGDFFGTVLSIVIPMLIIYFMVQAAQKAAEKYAGEIGKAVQSAGSTVTGLALGAATGGAALLGSNTIGRLANKASNSEGFKDWAAKNGMIGRMALKSVNSVGKGSFDARNTTIGKGAAKQLGINTDNKNLSMLGLDTKSTKGGYQQTQEDKVKAQEEYKKLLVTKKSDDEIRATYSSEQLKARDDYDKVADDTLYKRWKDKVKEDTRKDTGVVLADNDPSLNQAEWKKYKKSGKTKGDYEKAMDSYQKTTPPAIQVTAAERNKVRTNAYAEYKEKQSGGPFATQNYYNKAGNLVAKKGEVLRNPYADDDVYNTPTDGRNGVDPVKKKREKIAEKNSRQFFKELAEGAAKGAGVGALVGTAVVPGIGTGVGAGIGAGVGAIRQVLRYSGTTNKKIGAAVRSEPKKKDKIIDDLLKEAGEDAPATPAPAAPSTPPPTDGAGTTTP